MQLASQRACPQTWLRSLQRDTPASGLSPLPAPQASLIGVCRQRVFRQRRSTKPTAALASDSGAGNERVQDNLVDMIHVQIGQQHVKSYFEDESDRLRRTADEVMQFAALHCSTGKTPQDFSPQASFTHSALTCCNSRAICVAEHLLNSVAVYDYILRPSIFLVVLSC